MGGWKIPRPLSQIGTCSHHALRDCIIMADVNMNWPGRDCRFIWNENCDKLHYSKYLTRKYIQTMFRIEI